MDRFILHLNAGLSKKILEFEATVPRRPLGLRLNISIYILSFPRISPAVEADISNSLPIPEKIRIAHSYHTYPKG